MKKIKRIQVGSSNFSSTMKMMSQEEMLTIFGGTDNCWNVLEAMYSNVYQGEYISASMFQQDFASWMAYQEAMFSDGSAIVQNSGDPTLAQSDYLLKFIRQYFCATSEWNTGAVASLNFGITNQGDGTGSIGHAVIVEGGLNTDYATNTQYYNVYDVKTGARYRVSENNMLYVTPISGKNH